MRGKSHEPEMKAAVMAALLSGQGVNDVAREYNLDKSVVSRWAKEIPQEDLQQLATQKRDSFGELLSAYLVENLTTLKIQQEHFRDKEWLKRQSASDLAVLHGVTADKAIRLFEAAERANQE